MNLRHARVVLRPRGGMEVLDLAAPFCMHNWRLFLPLMALALGPPFTACLAARYLLGWSWVAVWLSAVALGGLAHAPFTVACGELLFHDARDVRLASIVGRVLRRTPSLLLAHVVVRLTNTLAASTMFLLPFTAGAFLVVHEAVLLEGAGPFQALGRSARAVRGQSLAAVGVATAMLLLPVVAVFAMEISLDAVVSVVLQLGEPFGNLWRQGGTPYALAGFFVTVPVSAAARFLKYVDLRTRKEGWDIQLRFMAIEAEARNGRAASKQATSLPVGLRGVPGEDAA